MTTSKKTLTTQEVADRFNELALQEKWFDIQDELFSEDVRSVEPENSPYLKTVTGKKAVRKKAEDWVKKIEKVHKLSTTTPVVGGNSFAVGRNMDFDVQGLGRVVINEIMVYEVKEGKIVLEQFFY